MTESEIVEAIRREFDVVRVPGTLTDFELSDQFRSQHNRSDGIREAHVRDALRGDVAIDRYDAKDLNFLIALARADRPVPHRLLVTGLELSRHRIQLVHGWRLFGPSPQDPTQALAHLIARYGLPVEAGDRLALFFARATLPGRTPIGGLELVDSWTINMVMRTLPSSTEYRWVFAIRDHEYVRDERSARKRAETIPSDELPSRLAERLSDDALVLRGGQMHPSDLVKAATVCRERFGYFAVSVWAAEVAGVHELTSLVSLPHAQVRWATAGRLRDAGLELRRTGGPFHYSLVVPDVTVRTLAGIADLFSPPVANPHPRLRAGGA